MRNPLFLRFLTLAVLVLVLMVPLSLVQGIVTDRQKLQGAVEQAIAESAAAPQQLSGPVLVVPITQSERVEEKDSASGAMRVKQVPVTRELRFPAAEMHSQVDVGTEEKYKGIYKAIVYEATVITVAQFNVPPKLGLSADAFQQTTIGAPHLAMALSDARGLRRMPEAAVNGNAVDVAGGLPTEAEREGIHAPLSVEQVLGAAQGEPLSAEIRMRLAGTGRIAIVPTAQTMRVSMQAAWPHPNFGGRFLPTTRTIDETGFRAEWNITALAHKNLDVIKRGGAASSLDAFSVAFIEPVNIYQQAERAIKYGVLFIALTFGAFFLVESLRALRIHPVQYGLVGVALALFFLLLLSLSEHMPFAWAYAISASACVALISYYLTHALGGWRAGLATALPLAALYAMLFGLLRAEDNALVMGSLLLFGLLATLMLLTRRVDWYALSQQLGEANPTNAPRP
jgi:inner membrane protein